MQLSYRRSTHFHPHTHRTDAHAPSRWTPENNTTPATQIVVSLLGRLSKGLLDADKGRRPPKPSVPQTKHHPSQVHQVGNRCCFYFVSPFASQGICTSVNQSSQSSHPQLLPAAAYEHQTQRNNPIVVSSVLTQHPGVASFLTLVCLDILSLTCRYVNITPWCRHNIV